MRHAYEQSKKESLTNIKSLLIQFIIYLFLLVRVLLLGLTSLSLQGMLLRATICKDSFTSH